MRITWILRSICLFSANRIKSSEYFSKQLTQLIVQLNSSLRHIIVKKNSLISLSNEYWCQDCKENLIWIYIWIWIRIYIWIWIITFRQVLNWILLDIGIWNLLPNWHNFHWHMDCWRTHQCQHRSFSHMHNQDHKYIGSLNKIIFK